MMKVSPRMSRLITNEETEGDKQVYDLFIQLKLNYLERMQDLSRLKIHEDLELIHYFSVYILKEFDNYRVLTCRGHMHEVYKGDEHYGDVFIVNENSNDKNYRKNLSIYEEPSMDKLYKTIDINKIVFDFNQLFKNVDKEKIAFEIRLI